MEWYVYIVIIAVVAYALRKQIFEWYTTYKERKAYEARLNRLSCDVPKFSEKEYRKNAKKAISMKMKKDRETREDGKV